MGWTSTGDPYANVGDSALCFESEEAAKAFAEKHGWEYTVHQSFLHFLLSFSVAYCPATHKYSGINRRNLLEAWAMGEG